jgi:alkylation response protein AidB-like acyl-CoA dehydrogenase
MLEYCAIAEELGAALIPEPLIGAVLSAALLRDKALEEHLTGTALTLPAWQDNRDAAAPEEAARVEGRKLYGKKRCVFMAHGADAFLVVGPRKSWLVEASDSGVKLEALPTQDGCHFGTLTLEGACGQEIDIDCAPAMAEACLATSAYLLGVIEGALMRTLEYLHTRVQFGKVIGTLQVLQHRAVDLKLQAELTRASLEDAAARWDREPASPGSYAAISRAKVRAVNAAIFVTRQAIQLHGGIGFTDEHDIGLFLRKVMVVAPQFGSAALHRARFAQLLPVNQAA